MHFPKPFQGLAPDVRGFLGKVLLDEGVPVKE
jgi:hypothetical protein